VRDVALRCGACGQVHPLGDLSWRCGRCGGVLDLTGFRAVLPRLADLLGRPPTLWRYAEALPVAEPLGLSMGEGMTPLIGVPGHPAAAVKVDYLMPTGSFKDRGAVLLAALAQDLAVLRRGQYRRQPMVRCTFSASDSPNSTWAIKGPGIDGSRTPSSSQL